LYRTVANITPADIRRAALKTITEKKISENSEKGREKTTGNRKERLGYRKERDRNTLLNKVLVTVL